MCFPSQHALDVLHVIDGKCSMASSGFCGLALLGEICPRNSVSGKPLGGCSISGTAMARLIPYSSDSVLLTLMPVNWIMIYGALTEQSFEPLAVLQGAEKKGFERTG
jgi:hypothetical protein